MKKHFYHYIKTLLAPCLFFSAVVGVFSTLLITIFKCAAEWVIHLSNTIYDGVRENPVWLPLLIVGVFLLGFAASMILRISRTCRGGGIPTSVAVINGIADFNWVRSIFWLPISTLLTFLCGVPLGTEGPCVQMGTAVGDGAIQLLGGKRHRGWRRYVMTGGASAGFSLATGAPITAILFSMEELHKRFSPLLLTIATRSVIFSQLTARLLVSLGIGSIGLFHFAPIDALPLKLFFIPFAVGLVCGVGSVLFTKLYHVIDHLMRLKLGKLSVKIKVPLIFVAVGLIGFFASQIAGTGHALIESLWETQTVWYLLLIVLLGRAVLMMVANTAGVTGGIFLPTLAIGAILGSLCADGFISIGLVGAEYRALFVMLGTTAFLGSTSRIPLTACVFAIEALGGINNVLAIVLAITAAYLIVEASGLEDFTDTVIENKAHAIHAGKKPITVEVALTVRENSFVEGKTLRDILWPVSCVVISFERRPSNHEKTEVSEGDVITVRYKTYEPAVTAKEFDVLVGKQADSVIHVMQPE